jgi:hypothetical protein
VYLASLPLSVSAFSATVEKLIRTVVLRFAMKWYYLQRNGHMLGTGCTRRIYSKIMPIPELTVEGILPNSIYDCSLEELEAVFGCFRSTDCRIALTNKLKAYIQELRQSGIGSELIIDGSYVTQKEDPGDIDLILVLARDFDFSSPINPFEYNLASNRAVKRKYGFDVFVEKKGTERYNSRIEFFKKVKYNPDATKGLLRVSL